jgi:nucleotide-binding universal stress UspA family protein
MKILVAYDGSSVSKAALKLARKRARAYGADIEVVAAMARSAGLKYEDVRKSEKKLEREVGRLFNGDDTPYKTYLAITDLSPGEELVEFAGNHNVDEIIIGVRRGSKVGKFVFGSNAQYVVLHAPCPVVSIK